MRAGPSSIARLIAETTELAAPPRPVVDITVDLCLSEGWSTSAGEARERAEQWESRVLASLTNDFNELVALGRLPLYAFNSSSPYLVQGAAFVERKDTAEIRSAKQQLCQLGSWVNAIASLSPREFEQLCAGILEELGVDEPVCTPYSGDEGIDFYGRLRLDSILLPSRVFPSVERQLAVWMVGQAKHYPQSSTSTFHIRELVGAVELAKGQAFGQHGEAYIQPPIRVCDPVFYMFFTTGRIATSAWRLMSRSGVIGMDGRMIAVLLSQRLGSPDPVEQALMPWVSSKQPVRVEWRLEAAD